MIPFQASFPQLPNQIQTDGSNSSAHQQVILSNLVNSSNPGCNHGDQFPCSSAYNNPLISQLFALNPQLPVPFVGSNTILSNFNGNFGAIPNTHFLNIANHHQPMQNTQMGMPHLGSQSHGHLHNFNSAPSQPNGQLFTFNLPQVTSQTRPFQPLVCPSVQGGQFGSHNPQHMNQITVLPHGQFSPHPIGLPQIVPFNMPPCSHPSMGSQSPSFLLNPQLGMMNSNEVGQHNTQIGQNALLKSQLGMVNSNEVGQHNTQRGQNALQKSPIAAQHMQSNSFPLLTDGPIQIQQTQKNMHPGSFQTSQGNHQGKNFTRNYHESGKRELAHPRFQKSKFHPMAKGNFKSFNGKEGKGHHDEGAITSHEQTRTEFQRSLPLNYSEQEIQQWRDDRKKNYPSKSKIEKKTAGKQTHSEVVDEDAKKRRQQLKEILAKQAELGVEVAELPPNYLSESENCKRGNKKWPKKGRFKNNRGKRQNHGRDHQFVKKQKFGDNNSTPSPVLHHKRPTLLKKLLSADIKRDKSHLLQVFRFMVKNSFFKDWPEKRLEFPKVIVKDMGCEGEMVGEKFECPKELITTDDDNDHDDGMGDTVIEKTVNGFIWETDSIKEDIVKSEGEEGEITD